MLTLVPCSHFWLAVFYGPVTIAICKRCKKKGVFTPEEWTALKQDGTALDKPQRV